MRSMPGEHSYHPGIPGAQARGFAAFFTRRRTLLEDLAIFAIAFLVVFAFLQSVGGLVCDGYYHARMAHLYFTGDAWEAGANFHWTRHSMWNGAYSDKDFLFHMVMVPFVVLMGGADISADNLETAGMLGGAFSAALTMLIALRVLRANGAVCPLLWALLMMAASETIIWRLSMCRAHVLSIGLALLSWHVIERGKAMAMVLVGAIYALAYTAPHLSLAFAAIWAVPKYFSARGEGRQRWRALWLGLSPMLWLGIGILVGLALHPNPVNMGRLWVVQNLVVPLHRYNVHNIADWLSRITGSGIVDKVVEVKDLGNEMGPPQSIALISTHILGFTCLIVPWVLAATFRYRPNRRDAALSLTAFATGVLFMLSERFAEYFFPFTTLAAAVIMGGVFRTPDWRAFRERHAKTGQFVWNVLSAILVGLIAGRLIARWIFRRSRREAEQRGASTPYFWQIATVAVLINLAARPVLLWIGVGERERESLRHAAMAFKEHVPPGEMIYHANWGAFPQLFFYGPEYDYVTGLDPTFMAYRDPVLYERYVAIRSGNVIYPRENTSNAPQNAAASVSTNGESGVKPPVSAAKTPMVYEDVLRDEFGATWVFVEKGDQYTLMTQLQRAEMSRKITLAARGRDDSWRLYHLVPPKP